MDQIPVPIYAVVLILIEDDGRYVLIQEAMEWKRAQGPLDVETKEKVVKQEEVAGYLQKGWSFVTKLDDEECVVRRRKKGPQ